MSSLTASIFLFMVFLFFLLTEENEKDKEEGYEEDE